MTLEDLRLDIDKIDMKITALLNQRMEKALLTKKLKKNIEDTGREMLVLDKIRRSSHCLLEPDFAEGLYKTIISETKRIQTTASRASTAPTAKSQPAPSIPAEP